MQCLTYPAFRPGRNCEQTRDVSLASLGTVISAWNRVRLVNARRGPDLLDLKRSKLLISVATQSASAEKRWWGMRRLVADMKTKNIGLVLEETILDINKSDFAPSETGFIVSAHRLTNHPVDPDSYTVVVRGVADLYP